MKVAVISEGWHPVFGGGQVHVEYLCKYLVQDFGASVDLFTRKIKNIDGTTYTEDEQHLDGKRRIYRVGPIGLFFDKFIRCIHLLYFTFWFLHKAHKEKYDIIHAHALLPGIPAKIAGLFLNIPVIYTVHGSIHLDSGRKNIFYYIEKFLITGIRYTKEIFVSHNTLRYKNKNKNIIIHNGVNIAAFDAIQDSKKHEGFSLLTVGRIDWQKNHILMIETINSMDREYLDKINFIRRVVGDGGLKNESIGLVHTYGLEKYIHFLGAIFGDDLIREYKRNHVFVLPSLAEGQPLTILEAFAAKIPVVATDVGDNIYIVENQKNGLLVSLNELHALKEAILRITTTDNKDLEAMGQQGYDLVNESYDRHTIIAMTYEVYLESIR